MADLSERVRASLAGRYTIERELGRGGMATCSEGEHVILHTQLLLRKNGNRRLLPAGDRLHEECQSVLETLGPRRLTLVVSQTNDDQVIGRNDQGGLAARTTH